MARQLIVFIENRPGALAEVTRVLAEAEVNIEAVHHEGSIDFGALRLHVDKVRKGETALRDAGFQVQSAEVIVLPLPNQPGALADVAERLAAAKVNVESIFGTAAGHADSPIVVLKVDDVARARKALGLDTA